MLQLATLKLYYYSIFSSGGGDFHSVVAHPCCMETDETLTSLIYSYNCYLKGGMVGTKRVISAARYP